jgi:hypothetical protein
MGFIVHVKLEYDKGGYSLAHMDVNPGYRGEVKLDW